VQLDLLERGYEPYRRGMRRVIYQGPCGSGKTWIAAEQTRRAIEKDCGTVLHVVHRRRLVDQMVTTLRMFGVDAGVIMQGRQRAYSRVYCASRDTLLAMIREGVPLPTAKLVVWDECHVAAREVQDWYLKNCPDAFWTGYTATPVRPDGASLAPPYQALVCMAPASKLIALGRLVPVKVYNPDALGRRRKKGDGVKPVGDPVTHWRKYADGLPTVVFAPTVAASRATAQRYCDEGISAEHIDASTPEDEREDVFERSRRGDTKVITNCSVLVEGVDLPWLTCCQILRGCNSLVLWCQANGRVMRPWEGKEHGICLDHAGAAHEFGLPHSDYVWTLDDAHANEKANKPGKDRKPVTCPRCGLVFVGKPACPECGHVLPRRRPTLAESFHGDGVLTKFSGRQESDIRRDALNRAWVRTLRIGRAKGWDMRRVAAVFGNTAKVTPWDAGLSHPLPAIGQWGMSAADWLEMRTTNGETEQ
jgi:superfamily II DNA or RNA helicase